MYILSVVLIILLKCFPCLIIGLITLEPVCVCACVYVVVEIVIAYNAGSLFLAPG